MDAFMDAYYEIFYTVMKGTKDNFLHRGIEPMHVDIYV